jgi:hypothetical protein
MSNTATAKAVSRTGDRRTRTRAARSEVVAGIGTSLFLVPTG